MVGFLDSYYVWKESLDIFYNFLYGYFLHESKVAYESATIGWVYSSCPENLLLSNWFARYFDHQNAYTGYPQFILPSFLRIIEEELCFCICVCFQSFIISLRMGRLKPLKKN